VCCVWLRACCCAWPCGCAVFGCVRAAVRGRVAVLLFMLGCLAVILSVYDPLFAVVQVVIYSGGFGSRVCYRSREFGDFRIGMKFVTRELCPGSQLARILSAFGPYLDCIRTVFGQT